MKEAIESKVVGTQVNLLRRISYGYRSNRSCHQAITKAQFFMRKYEMKYVAENALHQANKILEEDLKLTVNKKKTHLAHSSMGIKFHGVKIFG